MRGIESFFSTGRERAIRDVYDASSLAWTSLVATTMRRRTHVFASHEARGLRALTRRSDPRDVEKVVRNLERRSKAVDLRETEKMPALWGKWKLLYSNALPGGPRGTSSDVVGDVFQVIYEGGERVDHEVQFNLGNQSPPQGTTSWSLDNARPSGAVGAVLKHKCKIDVPRTVTITLEKVELGIGDLHVELPTLPEFLQPPDWTRSSTFDITYLDDELRVTRGDRGELRVFLREG